MSTPDDSALPVLLTQTKNVATLTLNRPRRGNALNSAMITLLFTYLTELATSPHIRVVVLTGSGQYFCTGMELTPGTSSGPAAVQQSFRESLRLYDTLATFPKPLVARINGPALGGGVGLVFTTDVRVAARSAYFALTEVKRGLLPAIISQYIVPEVGTFRAGEYMLTGRRVGTEEAQRAGFLTCVAEEGALDTKTGEYVEMLLGSAPGAIRGIKELVRAVGKGGRSEEAEESVKKRIEKTFLDMMTSEEAVYGIMSFAQKVKPDWDSLLNGKEKGKGEKEPKAKL